MIFLELNELRVSYEVNWLISDFPMGFFAMYDIHDEDVCEEPCLIWMQHMVKMMPLSLHIPKLYTQSRLYICANIIQDFSAPKYAQHSTLKIMACSIQKL